MIRASFDPTPTATDTRVVATFDGKNDAATMRAYEDARRPDYFDSHDAREWRSIQQQNRYGQ